MSQNTDNRIEDESIDIEDDEVSAEVLSQAARKAGEEAVKKAFAMGLPVAVWKDGRVVKRYSDGREELVPERSIK